MSLESVQGTAEFLEVSENAVGQFNGIEIGMNDWYSSLGAVQVIDYAESRFDYTESRFEDFTKEMDVVFDTVGGETLKRSWSVLRAPGRLATIASTDTDSSDPKVRQAFFIVEPNQKQLAEIGRLLDDGQLRCVVDKVIPLSEAPEAYAGKVARNGQGSWSSPSRN